MREASLTYHYDENGNRSSIAYDSGVKEAYEYNKDNKVISLINKSADGSEISHYSYTYDSVGRQVTKTDSYGTTNYTYDKAGRILKVDGPGKIDIYAYDGAGNRITANQTYKSLQPSGFVDDASGDDVQYILKKSDYTYSNAGKLVKLVERMYDESNKEVLRKTVNYYYDGNGNELSNAASWTHPHDMKLRQSTKGAVNADNKENGTDSLDPLIDRVNNTFDGFNRLVKVENISAGVRSVSEYLYNGDDLRVSKTVKKSTSGYKEEVTNYLYDRQYVILETDKDNKVKTRYVKGINYIASISADNKTSYFLFNGHGDVVQTVDKTGEVQNNYDYDIWGNPTLTVETVKCAIRYAGEFYDSETGLYYLRARYYDPYIGRFLSEDSYWGEDDNPLSLNRYTYTHNDPIQYLDPTGHAVIKKGAQGDSVVAIQEMLQDLGYNTGKADGIYGSKTEAAIKQFQKDNGLKVDGIVGNQSITALKTLSSVKDAPDYVKTSAKKSISNAKTGDIKDDTIIMSSKSFDNVLNEITAAQKTTNGGSVQYEVKNNTVGITGVTVKSNNSKSAEVKATPAKETKSNTKTTAPATAPEAFKSSTTKSTSTPSNNPKGTGNINGVTNDNSKTQKESAYVFNPSGTIAVTGEIAAGEQVAKVAVSNPYVAATVILTGVLTILWPAQKVNVGEDELLASEKKTDQDTEGADKTDSEVPTGQAGRGQSKGGKHVPENLKEELGMEEVISNPENGRELVGKNTDKRWPANEGWEKWVQNVNGVEIHYEYNPLTGEIDDVKIK